MNLHLKYILPLQYPTDAFEPVISKETTELHFYKHLHGYEQNLIKLLDTQDSLEDIIISNSINGNSSNDDGKRQAILNNAGQVWNHNKFFSMLCPPRASHDANICVNDALRSQFGSAEEFEAQFIAAGMRHFGSGWLWLVVKNGQYEIFTTHNGDNPLMTGYSPEQILLGIDLWEHAYYLDYQNRRADYLKEFMKLVDWNNVLFVRA